MKKITAVAATGIMLVAALFIISISGSAAGKKDLNCISRCKLDYNNCVKSAKGQKIVDRLNSEDECKRVMNTCVALCPESI